MKYSSDGQDYHVLKAIGDEGFFVDVGASDGIHSSNTYLLEKAGWEGVCVEPVDFVELTKNRDCIVYYAVVDGTKRKVDFALQGKRNGEHYGLSGIIEHYPESKKHFKTLQERYDAVAHEVHTQLLADILDEVEAPKTIDFLDIDIEGADLAVLSTFPFDRYKFRYINVEGGRCTQLLEDNGYELVKKFTIDRMYKCTQI